MAPVDERTHRAIEQLIYEWARMIDEDRLEELHTLLTDDGETERLLELAVQRLRMDMARRVTDAGPTAFAVRDQDRLGQPRLDRRGGIDCMEQLQFNAVPAFWQQEIARFYARSDVDRVRYSKLVLRLLLTRAPFRAVLDAFKPAASGFAPDAAALDAIARDELFMLLLRDALVSPQCWPA